jgi:hypothetical protein
VAHCSIERLQAPLYAGVTGGVGRQITDSWRQTSALRGSLLGESAGQCAAREVGTKTGTGQVNRRPIGEPNQSCSSAGELNGRDIVNDRVVNGLDGDGWCEQDRYDFRSQVVRRTGASRVSDKWQCVASAPRVYVLLDADDWRGAA